MVYYAEMDRTKTKLAASDWLEAALQALAESGISAVAVEPLAKKMKVTKGSFYWHFKNRKNLLDEVLTYWENIELHHINEFENNKKITASDTLKNILTILISDKTNKRVFLALSNSNKEPSIKIFYDRAVARRLKLFIHSYINMGLSPEKAKSRAPMTYCTYLGLIKLLNDENANVLNSNSRIQLIEEVINSAIYTDR